MLEKKCCVPDCYKDAMFGTGANRMKGIYGRDWCLEHYRQELERQRAEKSEFRQLEKAGQMNLWEGQ